MTALIVIAVILGVIGVLGSVLPGLAGPPISWVGLLLMYLAHTSDPVSLTALLVWLAVVVVITVVDYFIPAALTRTFGGHKAASIGATIGLFAGGRPRRVVVFQGCAGDIHRLYADDGP